MALNHIPRDELLHAWRAAESSLRTAVRRENEYSAKPSKGSKGTLEKSMVSVRCMSDGEGSQSFTGKPGRSAPDRKGETGWRSTAVTSASFVHADARRRRRPDIAFFKAPNSFCGRWDGSLARVAVLQLSCTLVRIKVGLASWSQDYATGLTEPQLPIVCDEAD